MFWSTDFNLYTKDIHQDNIQSVFSTCTQVSSALKAGSMTCVKFPTCYNYFENNNKVHVPRKAVLTVRDNLPVEVVVVNFVVPLPNAYSLYTHQEDDPLYYRIISRSLSIQTTRSK